MRRRKEELKPTPVNWTLFVVLLTTILSFNWIHHFGLLAGDKCIGHANYWLTENSWGLSMFQALFVIFLLCLLWALIDLFKLTLHKAPKRKFAVFFTLTMLATSVICTKVVHDMEALSPFIDAKLAAAKIEMSSKPWYLRSLAQCTN